MRFPDSPRTAFMPVSRGTSIGFPMQRLLACLTLCLLAALPLQAACQGKNLIDALPPDQRAALERAAAAVPFAQGNLWRATRAGAEIILVGTFHLDDPRHDPIFARLAPLLARARTLLVEAGPEEEALLSADMTRNPSRMFDFSGPRLDETLGPDNWQRLAAALIDRNMAPPLALKMRPWYLMVMVSIAPCQMAEMAKSNGLDRRLIDAATAQGKPIQALEPWDTIFHLFDSVTPADQLSLLMQAVDAGAAGNDMAVTLADSYFAGKNRLLWGFARHEALLRSDLPDDQINRATDRMEEVLISSRNRTWIAAIEAAAAQGPVMAAFGALHLSGEAGVLNLLARNGWTITPLDP